MQNNSVEECLKRDLFAFWPDNDDWVRVSGTNLLFQPHHQVRYQWYLVNDSNENYIRDCSIEKLFSEDSLSIKMGRGQYIEISTEEIIELLPEYLQVQFIFNIDLISKGKSGDQGWG